jgi:hypothetical protein
MFGLNNLNNDNKIAIIAIIVTALTIIVSTWLGVKTINHSLIEAKQQITLEQTGELPLQVAEFCSAASNVATVSVIGQAKLSNEEKAEFDSSEKRLYELFPKIKNSIYAYGSNDAIKIYTKFETIIKFDPNETSVEAFYILPLLLAQVKMDVTGEKVNPLTFLDSFMPQFSEHRDKAKDYINKTIDELKLDNDLRINYSRITE